MTKYFPVVIYTHSTMGWPAPTPNKVCDKLGNKRDGNVTMPLSLKTIGSAGYRDQWNKRFGCLQVNQKCHGCQREGFFLTLSCLGNFIKLWAGFITSHTFQEWTSGARVQVYQFFFITVVCLPSLNKSVTLPMQMQGYIKQ